MYRVIHTNFVGALACALLLIQPKSLLAASVSLQSAALNESPNQILTLRQATHVAVTNDEWLSQSQLMQSRLDILSEAATSLPEPVLNIGLINLPTDGLALDQEPMTQFKVGASQRFLRGDTLQLRQKKLALSATEQPHLRATRRRQVELQTSHIWLDAFAASASYRLVNETRPLLDKLKNIVNASYASTSGNTQQEDIIRAELELLKLKDRLFALDAQKRVALAKLSAYLRPQSAAASFDEDITPFAYVLPMTLAEEAQMPNTVLNVIENADLQSLYTLLQEHPALLANRQKTAVADVDIEIAEQAYKPQFAINASYAIRGNGPNGLNRADFLSVGATVSMPLFSTNQQDADVSGAKLMKEALKTQQHLIMRELIGGLTSAYEDFTGYSARLAVYQDTILPQMAQHSEATLAAYYNDKGSFSDVVRSKIAELDAALTALDVSISQRKALASLSYYIPSTTTTQDISHE